MKKNRRSFGKQLTSVLVFVILLLCTFVGTSAYADTTGSDPQDSPEPITFSLPFQVESKLSYDAAWSGSFGFRIQKKVNENWENIAIVPDAIGNDRYTKYVDMSVTAPTAPNAEKTVTFDLCNLKERYDSAGEYCYRIIQAIPAQKRIGVTYDTQTYEVQVFVEKNNKNKLYISNISNSEVIENPSRFSIYISYSNGTVASVRFSPIKFNNKYDSSKVVSIAPISGSKVLSGRDWKDSDVFTFDLYRGELNNNGSVSAAGNAILTDTVKGTDADHTFTFTDTDGKYTAFDQAGTYYYVVKERAGNIPDLIYDTKEYVVKVEVTQRDANGSLSTEIYVDEERGDASEMQKSIVFTNTRKAANPVEITLNVKKELINKDAYANGLAGFTFELLNQEGTVIDTVRSDQNGDASFKLTFTEPDVGRDFVYTIHEVDTKIPDITYSAKTYNITLAVEQNDDASLAVKFKNGEAAEYVFTNTYSETTTDPDDPNDPDNPNGPTDPNNPNNPNHPNDPTDPDDPNGPTNPDNGAEDQPRTGDAGIALWIALLAASGAIIAFLLMHKRRQMR